MRRSITRTQRVCQEREAVWGWGEWEAPVVVSLGVCRDQVVWEAWAVEWEAPAWAWVEDEWVTEEWAVWEVWAA